MDLPAIALAVTIVGTIANIIFGFVKIILSSSTSSSESSFDSILSRRDISDPRSPLVRLELLEETEKRVIKRQKELDDEYSWIIIAIGVGCAFVIVCIILRMNELNNIIIFCGLSLCVYVIISLGFYLYYEDQKEKILKEETGGYFHNLKEIRKEIGMTRKSIWLSGTRQNR